MGFFSSQSLCPRKRMACVQLSYVMFPLANLALQDAQDSPFGVGEKAAESGGKDHQIWRPFY